MSESLGLGRLIGNKNPQKDAVHVAVCPIECAETLKPGQHVGLNEEGKAVDNKNPIGVIDPFLECYRVKVGEKCWLFMYPGSITSLRHEWTHPAFARARLSIEDVLEFGHEAAKDGSCYVGQDEQSEVFNSERDEFWEHFTAYTGVVPIDKDCYFSCAC